jgi:hypothetical protein
VAALGGALTHSVNNLRKEASAALGEIADPAALPFLLPCRDDPDPDVRKLARWAISQCDASGRRPLCFSSGVRGGELRREHASRAGALDTQFRHCGRFPTGAEGDRAERQQVG